MREYRQYRIGKNKFQIVTEAVPEFDHRHEGVVIKLGGPGAREPNCVFKLTRLKTEMDFFATSFILECVSAAIVNPIDQWTHKEKADMGYGI